MLALTRRKDTAVRIGEDVLVTFRGFRDREARLEVDLPSGCAMRGPEGLVETQPGPKVADRGQASKGVVYLKKEECLYIGDEIRIQVIRILTDDDIPCTVRLGFDVPAHIAIRRTELGQLDPPSTTQAPSDDTK